MAKTPAINPDIINKFMNRPMTSGVNPVPSAATPIHSGIIPPDPRAIPMGTKGPTSVPALRPSLTPQVSPRNFTMGQGTGVQTPLNTRRPIIDVASSPAPPKQIGYTPKVPRAPKTMEVIGRGGTGVLKAGLGPAAMFTSLLAPIAQAQAEATAGEGRRIPDTRVSGASGNAPWASKVDLNKEVSTRNINYTDPFSGTQSTPVFSPQTTSPTTVSPVTKPPVTTPPPPPLPTKTPEAAVNIPALEYEQNKYVPRTTDQYGAITKNLNTALNRYDEGSTEVNNEGRQMRDAAIRASMSAKSPLAKIASGTRFDNIQATRHGYLSDQAKERLMGSLSGLGQQNTALTQDLDVQRKVEEAKANPELIEKLKGAAAQTQYHQAGAAKMKEEIKQLSPEAQALLRKTSGRGPHTKAIVDLAKSYSETTDKNLKALLLNELKFATENPEDWRAGTVGGRGLDLEALQEALNK